MYNSAAIYDFYKEQGGTLPKKVFQKLCSECNKRIVAVLLEGREFPMWFGMGGLRIFKSKYNFKKQSIDWKQSKEYRDELLAKGEKLYDHETGEGTKWLIHRIPEYMYIFKWLQGRKRIRNSQVYKFIPSRTSKPTQNIFPGALDRLLHLVNEDELAYLRFRDRIR